MRLLYGTILSFGLAAAAGCAGVTSPSAATGTYVLRAVNGASLPAAILHDQRGAVLTRATGGALVLLPGNRVEWSREFATASARATSEAALDTARSNYTGTYARTGDRLVIDFVSTTGADRFPWRIEARAEDRVVTLYVPLPGVDAGAANTRAEEYRRD